MDDYIEINNISQFNLSQYSLISFFKSGTYSINKVGPIFDFGFVRDGGYGIWISSSGLWSYLRTNASYTDYDLYSNTESNFVNRYTYSSVLFDLNNDIFGLYSNAYLDSSKKNFTDKITPLSLNYYPRIGAQSKFLHVDRYFNGQIDEIRIYNRTLSEQEIGQLYWYSIKQNQAGINEIDLSSCNLNKGNEYQIVAFTDDKKLEHTIIAK